MPSTPAFDSHHLVTIEVPSDHSILQIRATLDWESITTCMAGYWRSAGKNVDHGPGRPFDFKFWTRVIVLMLLLKLDLRQMERELKYNAVTRLFVEVEQPTEGLVRDHANIDRTYRALGVKGLEALNSLIIRTAEALDLTDGEVLSSDPTIQEVRVPYPNEPGILHQVAQRIIRFGRRVLKKGGEGFREVVERVSEKTKKLFASVKEYRLFAKGKEKKASLLEQMLGETSEMMAATRELQIELTVVKGNRVLERVEGKLSDLQNFTEVLIEQILGWMKSGKVATEKRLHPGITELRSHVRNKPGKKVEFGFKWLVNRLSGGYLFGQMFFGRPSDSKMPKKAIAAYQKTLKTKGVPKIFVFDRGGWSAENTKLLKELKVEKIGIQPKGQADWLIGDADQDMVRTLRGQTEGSIGTLKTGGYGFNKPRTYSTQTTEMAGHRAFVSRNLNQLIMDLQKMEMQG